jgi:hypothetical protein
MAKRSVAEIRPAISINRARLVQLLRRKLSSTLYIDMINYTNVDGALILAEISQWENEGGAIVQSANAEPAKAISVPTIIAPLLLALIAALAVYCAFS